MSLLRRSVSLEDQIVLDRLLDDAFVPARLRTVGISAARVRARLAWEQEVPVGRGWRAAALLGRLGETSLALGMTAILFAGSLGGAGAQVASDQPQRGSAQLSVGAPPDDSTLLRLLRLGRTAFALDDSGRTPALSSRESEAEWAATLRERQGLRRSTPALTSPADDGDPPVEGRERLGLLR